MSHFAGAEMNNHALHQNLESPLPFASLKMWRETSDAPQDKSVNPTVFCEEHKLIPTLSWEPKAPTAPYADLKASSNFCSASMYFRYEDLWPIEN